jgi:hypothetical protein
MENMTDMGGE